MTGLLLLERHLCDALSILNANMNNQYAILISVYHALCPTERRVICLTIRT